MVSCKDDGMNKGHNMRLTLLFFLGGLIVLVACGKDDKFSEYKVVVGNEAETLIVPAQDAISMPFSGGPEDIPVAAERLYIEMRRLGRFFGGPLRLECMVEPDWTAKKLTGRILFPLAPGVGAREYADRPESPVKPEIGRVSGGRYSTILFDGPLQALEAGHLKLRDAVGKASGQCVFMFEGTLKEIDKRYRVRLMARTGE